MNPVLTLGALQKPSKEASELARRTQKAHRRIYERQQKAAVVRRDGRHTCRLVPGCLEREKFETAHVEAKGMGGTPSGIRNHQSNTLRACFFHHQGRWSLHSGDLRVEYLTPHGTDGPILVWGTVSDGQWGIVGREVAVGHWEQE